MSEQTILQCARCLTHTPLIETCTQESILEAIAANASCKNCGWHVMLCFDSRTVVTGRPWRKYYASQVRNRGKQDRQGTSRPKARYNVEAPRRLPKVRERAQHNDY